MTADAKPLSGLRVLVPRGGVWGDLVSKALRQQGASPVVAPLVDFAHTSEEDVLVGVLKDLESGKYDWMTATSATVVDVLAHHDIKIPTETEVAVVGQSTAAAFTDAGYSISRMPTGENHTTKGLLEVWPEIDTGDVLKVLTLRSDVAKPVLTEGLIGRGHDVTQVVAFRTVGVPASVHIREDVTSGRINAILIGSPKIAQEVASQFPDLPEDTLVVCVGPHTHDAAVAAGVPHTANTANSEYGRALIETVESALHQSDMLD
ncbi:MAG: uroporphyrinogen-III synthase [Leucobacter sp.]